MDNKYGLDLEIGGLWYAPFWQSNLFYGIVGLILILLLFGIVYKWRKSFKKTTNQDPVLVLVESLQKQEQQIAKGNAQLFYFELVSKFKKFIDYKYQSNLQYSTDIEIKNFLLKEDLGPINRQLIETFLEILDRSYVIRFAKNNVSKTQMSVDLQKTIDLMQQVLNQPSEKQ